MTRECEATTFQYAALLVVADVGTSVKVSDKLTSDGLEPSECREWIDMLATKLDCKERGVYKGRRSVSTEHGWEE